MSAERVFLCFFFGQVGQDIFFAALDVSGHGFFGFFRLVVPDVFQQPDVLFRGQTVVLMKDGRPTMSPLVLRKIIQ